MKKMILFLIIFSIFNQLWAKELVNKEQIVFDVLGLRFNDFSDVEVDNESISLKIYDQSYNCKSDISFSSDIKHKNNLIYKVSISECKKAGRSNRFSVNAEVRANQKTGELVEIHYQFVAP